MCRRRLKTKAEVEDAVISWLRRGGHVDVVDSNKMCFQVDQTVNVERFPMYRPGLTVAFEAICDCPCQVFWKETIDCSR